jgi:hypothetical protein
MKFTRRAAMIVATLAATPIISIASALPAAAICDAPRTLYSFTEATNVWVRTNVSSAYIKGPGSVSITKGRGWTATGTVTATVSAEAGVVFAKASASLGVSVAYSRSGSTAFTYTLNVPSGKTQRMQQYKRGKGFLVTKKVLQSPCTYRTVYSKQHVTGPVSSNAESSYLYKLVS